MPIVKLTKTPSESKAFDIVFEADVDAETATITTDLTEDSQVAVDNTLTVTLSGGTDKTEYRVRATIGTETNDIYIVVLLDEDENVYYYGSVKQANVYFNTLPTAKSTTWVSNTEIEKRKALIAATRCIDRLAFKGNKYVATQPLEFPRASGTVPDTIEQAAYLICLKLMVEIDADSDFSNVDVISERFHSIAREYKKNRNLTHIVSGIPSIEAWKLLFPFLRSQGNITIY